MGKTSRRIWLSVIILLNLVTACIYAESSENPCVSSSALLNFIDRPTVADSACVVPYKKALLETGYQYQYLTHSTGYQQNYPDAEFRLGLPYNNELSIVLPNYIYQSMTPDSGFGSTALGIKHELGYNQDFVASAEAIFTLPSGSAAFGSKGLGTAINGIVSYNLNPSINLSIMLGYTTTTQSSNDGGQRFWSINPDIVLTYAATEKFNFYAEIYGQTKTAPTEGSGFNADGGVLYLLFPSFEVDMEVGQRLSGNLNSFSHYLGVGLGILF